MIKKDLHIILIFLLSPLFFYLVIKYIGDTEGNNLRYKKYYEDYKIIRGCDNYEIRQAQGVYVFYVEERKYLLSKKSSNIEYDWDSGGSYEGYFCRQGSSDTLVLKSDTAKFFVAGQIVLEPRSPL